SFIVVALLLVLLRSSGEVIGWGFQLQSPLVVGALVYLFLAIALNLLGVFEIGTRLMQFGSAGTGQGGYAGSFATGVLATVVAAPCTAPFMGAAVGFALTQSLMTTVLVFAALGVGMALPLLLLSLSPGLVRRMPRPGRWMEILRQLLAFPMLASMIWLAWVLGVQVGATGMMQILAGALALGFALWSNAVFTTPAIRWPLVLTAIAVSGYLLVSLPSVQQQVTTTVTREGGFPAGSYSVEVLAEARQAGPVFVNFTAAWCITCKVNELNALDSEAVKRVFAEEGVTYLKGDWTNEDPEITRALESHGRSGVPLYLFYREGADEAEILPQMLTPGIVVEAVRGR
ncbi:MAG: thioredoxin family protein, partial [Proteobacteria bacterium]|nr:thioredoxin family protein [Pseudomonadota bacterium]